MLWCRFCATCPWKANKPDHWHAASFKFVSAGATMAFSWLFPPSFRAAIVALPMHKVAPICLFSSSDGACAPPPPLGRRNVRFCSVRGSTPVSGASGGWPGRPGGRRLPGNTRRTAPPPDGPTPAPPPLVPPVPPPASRPRSSAAQDTPTITAATANSCRDVTAKSCKPRQLPAHEA